MTIPIIKDDGCLYCPDCDSRIIIRDPKPYGAIEKRIVIYGQCKCEMFNTEWNFEYRMDKDEYKKEEKKKDSDGKKSV